MAFGQKDILNLAFCYFQLKPKAGMLFFEQRRTENSMCHFKEIGNGCKKHYFNLWGTEAPFRANLLFGYAQSGSERNSFSGSTALCLNAFWYATQIMNQYKININQLSSNNMRQHKSISINNTSRPSRYMQISAETSKQIVLAKRHNSQNYNN